MGLVEEGEDGCDMTVGKACPTRSRRTKKRLNKEEAREGLYRVRDGTGVLGSRWKLRSYYSCRQLFLFFMFPGVARAVFDSGKCMNREWHGHAVLAGGREAG